MVAHVITLTKKRHDIILVLKELYWLPVDFQGLVDGLQGPVQPSATLPDRLHPLPPVRAWFAIRHGWTYAAGA